VIPLAIVLGTPFLLGMAPGRSGSVAAERPAIPAVPITRSDLHGHLLGLTNGDRRAADLDPLSVSERLSRYATRHSRRMAELGYLFHSSDAQLREALRGSEWAAAGENVGVASTLEGLQAAFMASRPHRHNVLESAYDRAAVGVVESGGVLWVTVVFVDH
jgi:uncharacterized protein YkwD